MAVAVATALAAVGGVAPSAASSTTPTASTVTSTVPAVAAAFSGAGFTLMPSLTSAATAAPEYVVKLADSTLADHRATFVAAAREINEKTPIRVRIAPGTHPTARPSDRRAEIVAHTMPTLLNPANGQLIDGWAGITDGTATHQRVDSGQMMQLDSEIWAKSAPYAQSIVLHELGHALGLAHDSDPAQLMHATVDGSENGRLNAGDIAGLTYLGRNLPNCADVVAITARGTIAPPGHDAPTRAVLNAVRRTLESGTSRVVRDRALVYPAQAAGVWSTEEGGDGAFYTYDVSMATGTLRLIDDLEQLASSCPATKTVLIGFSQGANVISDALDDRGVRLSARAAGNVAAATLLADSSYRGDETWSRGTAAGKTRLVCGPDLCQEVTTAGFVPRGKGSLDSVAAKLRSWCQLDDSICAQQQVIANDTHSTYYGSAAASADHDAAASFAGARVGAEPVPVPATLTTPTTFTSGASSAITRTADEIGFRICDPGRVGQRVWVQLSRSGGNFAVVDKTLDASGCATFADLDGAGPPQATTYTARVGLNRYPDRSWPTSGCFAATGGQALCDSTSTKTWSAASTSTPSWTTNEINHRICDPNRVNTTVRVQLSRTGKTFPVVSKVMPTSGCVTFTNLDGDGPVNPDTTYSLRAALDADPSQSWPATACHAATGGLGLCDQFTTTRFTSAARTSVAVTANEIDYTVCDPNRVGQRAFVQLTRPGREFAVVSRPLPTGGCTTFTNLELDGPVLANTAYVVRVALNQAPSTAWPTSGCYAATGGLGMCDPASTGSANALTFQLPFRCGQTWTASNYSGHGYGNLDFNLPGEDLGQPVLASASGTVYLYRWQSGGGGHVLWLKHPNGMFTVYGHLRYQPTVSVGQGVTQGQVIGYVGATGRTTGAHLHYEQQDALDRAVRPYFNGVASPVASEGDPPAAITSRNSC